MASSSSATSSPDSWKEIDRLDLSRIEHKLRLQAVKDGRENDVISLTDQIEHYRNFLKLIALYPDVPLVPTEEIDHIWHQHILDTARYQPDCIRSLGFPVHHYPYFGIHGPEDAVNLEQAFIETRRLYRAHFVDGGYEAIYATRCAGHACHVKSECACRVPGACKNEDDE